ncbi:hypothetical protein WA026_015057 [Henosepilachna vigintioctopunctata]|uniref:Uncharacterized protein n=1 Tax=Henosepilachna vigintioctopunctata TaxID=420089 RepID=A0AAW1U834_9CUCU
MLDIPEEPTSEIRYCEKHTCGADVYKRILGPTLDESLFVFLLVLLEIMEIWKICTDDDESTEMENNVWNGRTESRNTPLYVAKLEQDEDKKKKKRRCQRSFS